MQDEKGFSLVELLIVVAIIGLIAAIAVPNLIRARMSADAASAISSVRTLVTGENLYANANNGAYADMAALVPTGTLDSNLASGSKSAYLFTVSTNCVVGQPVPTVPTFQINADPFEDPGNQPHYFSDQTAVIRVAFGAPATATSQGL